MHACVFRRSLCLCVTQTGRSKKKKKEHSRTTTAFDSHAPLCLLFCFLLCRKPAARSGHLGPRKYAAPVIERTASYCQASLKEGKGVRLGDGFMYMGFRFSCLLTSWFNPLTTDTSVSPLFVSSLWFFFSFPVPLLFKGPSVWCIRFCYIS